MALKTKTQLSQLDTSWLGRPFARIEAKSLSSTELDVSWLGQPFVGASGVVTLNQSVSPSLFTSVSLLFAAVVSAAAIALSAPVTTNTNSFFEPSVSVSATTLSVPSIASTSEVFAPSVYLGQPPTQTLLTTLYTASTTFYAATVLADGVNVLPALLPSSSQLFTHAISAGPVTLFATRHTAISAFYAPAVKGLNTLLPEPVLAVTAFYAPAVIPGEVTLASQLHANTNVFQEGFLWFWREANASMRLASDSRAMPISTDSRRMTISADNRTMQEI